MLGFLCITIPNRSHQMSKYLLNFPTIYVLHFVVRNVYFIAITRVWCRKSFPSLFEMTIVWSISFSEAVQAFFKSFLRVSTDSLVWILTTPNIRALVTIECFSKCSSSVWNWLCVKSLVLFLQLKCLLYLPSAFWLLP